MILDEIVEKTKLRLIREKEKVSLEEMKKKALSMDADTGFPFEKALKQKDIQFICEVKKASPSKGLIAPDFPYLAIAREYEEAGAAAISVLTEPDFFQGSTNYLEDIAKEVSIPVLRKDFVIDEYMIYQAKVIGASAVLLICAILDDEKLKCFFDLADSLGLSVLVETHDEEELDRALKMGARVIGVNNRNLKNFTVDIDNSIRLRKKITRDVVFVSESGIKAESDVRKLKENRTDAVLIGETFMRSPDKKKMLANLRGEYACKVKICGLMRKEDVEYVNKAGADFAGFVFAKSRRQISYETAKEFKKLLNPQIQAVGVFVDEDKETVLKYLTDGVIDIAQLHGNEGAEYIGWLKDRTEKPVIAVIKLPKEKEASKEEELNKEKEARKEKELYKEKEARREEALNKEKGASIDKEVQKTMNINQDLSKILSELADKERADFFLFDSGKGSGKTFDLNCLTEIVSYINRPYFVAGGLDADNIQDVIAKAYPFAVDLSSGVETNGSKDGAKIQETVEKVHMAH